MHQYYDENGNLITITTGSSSGSLIVNPDGSLPADCNTVYVDNSINTRIKMPKLEAIDIILNNLLKDVMFEVIYPDGKKVITDYNGAMSALLMSDSVKIVKAIPNSDAVKVLYGKKEQV